MLKNHYTTCLCVHVNVITFFYVWESSFLYREDMFRKRQNTNACTVEVRWCFVMSCKAMKTL